jgi:1-acyl-sn-glycerol-3-phosphate acyltransferase
MSDRPEPRSAPPPRRRPPPARIAPEALAARRGGAAEGLEWLGRRPESRGPWLYHVLRLVARAVLFGVFRFRIQAEGRDLLPAGPYLLVAAAHRGWMDPFVVLHALPTEPRAWFLGSGPSTFTGPLREWLIRRIGGLLPV